MYKIGVIGDKESVWGFKAVGLYTQACESSEEAANALHRMAKEEYAIIYITESLCAAEISNYFPELTGDMDQYRSQPLPAIIPIPGREGSLGIGMRNVKNAVEKAVGVDLLFGGE